MPAWRLSRVVAGTAGGLALAGSVFGGAIYLYRGPELGPVPGTYAWLPHLFLTAVGALVLLLVVRRRGASTLVAPLGRRAAARLAVTFRAGGRGRMLRRVAAVPLVAIMLFSCWRAGVQVTAGLDPNFTGNAWGGPTYIGAMFCHYVDLAWIVGVSAALLNLLLVPTAPRAGLEV
ncbi:hypothetical protein GCM10020369_37930 [Cryptosporangium minutisporangium]|uniref:Uncharacterized protein n=1 Tax=Cryptosporangium minutisporangium TaxID=113569 RepID=A0ABP6T038_9ACTN